MQLQAVVYVSLCVLIISCGQNSNLTDICTYVRYGHQILNEYLKYFMSHMCVYVLET